MNTLPLVYQFIITGAVWLIVGVLIGAVNVRKLSAAWKTSAKYWRYEAIRQKDYNWNLAEESFDTGQKNEKLTGLISAWQDHYNQSLRAEIKLREQLLVNGIEPDA